MTLDDLFPDCDVPGDRIMMLFKPPVRELVEGSGGNTLSPVEAGVRHGSEDHGTMPNVPTTCAALDGPGVVGWVIVKSARKPTTAYAMKADGSLEWPGRV